MRPILALAATLLATAVIAAPVPKAARVDLNWKFTKGDTFYVRYEAEHTEASGGPGGDKSEVRRVCVWRFQVLEAAATETKLELEFVSYHVGTRPAGKPYRMNEVKAASGETVTVTLDETRRVTKVVGMPRVARAVADPLARRFLSDDQMRPELTDLFRSCTDTPQSVAGEWTAKGVQPIGDGLVAKVEFRGQLASVKGDVATVTGEEDVTVEPDPVLVRQLRIPALGGVRLTGMKNPVRVTFDVKAGRLVSREATRELSGRIETGNGIGPVDTAVTSKVRTTATVSATKPNEE
jgi:hypothetical protein